MGLLGKITGSESAKKSAKRQRKDAALREGAALNELTPQAMQALMQQFFSKYMALLSPNMMAGQQGAGASAARSGLTGAGMNRSIAAGIPGLTAQKALGMSIDPAMSVASQRSNTIMGRPIIPNAVSPGYLGELLTIGRGMNELGEIGKNMSGMNDMLDIGSKFLGGMMKF